MSDNNVVAPPNDLHHMGTASPQMLKLFLNGALLIPFLNGIAAEGDHNSFHQIIVSPRSSQAKPF
jgi:hypothetical protein